MRRVTNSPQICPIFNIFKLVIFKMKKIIFSKLIIIIIIITIIILPNLFPKLQIQLSVLIVVLLRDLIRVHRYLGPHLLMYMGHLVESHQLYPKQLLIIKIRIIIKIIIIIIHNTISQIIRI